MKSCIKVSQECVCNTSRYLYPCCGPPCAYIISPPARALKIMTAIPPENHVRAAKGGRSETAEGVFIWKLNCNQQSWQSVHKSTLFTSCQTAIPSQARLAVRGPYQTFFHLQVLHIKQLRARGGWPSGLERSVLIGGGMECASSNPGEGKISCVDFWALFA